MIWLALLPVCHPCSLSRKRSLVARWSSSRRRWGSLATMSRAAIAAALVAAGWAVEKTYGRARLASQSMSDCRPQTKPPPVPRALLSVPMRMWTRSWREKSPDPFSSTTPRPCFAEDAGGVGFVDQEHRIVLFGQFGEARERGEVAVHAEERVGGDQPAAEVARCAEHLFECFRVAVRVDEARGPGQPAAVDEAGVVLGVGKDRVAVVHQRGNDAGVGGEAGREDKGCFGAFELGEAALQFGVTRRTATHQRTRATAPPFALDRRAGGRCQPRVRRQAEVVVRAEVHQLAAIERNRGRLRTVADRQPSPQPGSLQAGELIINPGQRVVFTRRHHITALCAPSNRLCRRLVPLLDRNC